MTNSGIFWLTDPRCQNAEITGNKGATLARLTAAGYKVPAGFCISANKLNDAPLNLKTLPSSSWTSALQRELLSLPRPWVVRSSSTAEDSHKLSFAGVFRTILGLTSIEGVLEAVETIIASKGLETSQRYTKHHGINANEIRMAVIVQMLVSPVCSGVAFSRHPVTHTRRVVIEASYGLADILVDGSIIPDLLEVLEDGSVEIVRIGTKRLRSVFSGGQLIKIETHEKDRNRPSLSQDSARNLAALVRRIESDFGGPQDVEWAITPDSIFVIQARPITIGLKQ